MPPGAGFPAPSSRRRRPGAARVPPARRLGLGLGLPPAVVPRLLVLFPGLLGLVSWSVLVSWSGLVCLVLFLPVAAAPLCPGGYIAAPPYTHLGGYMIRRPYGRACIYPAASTGTDMAYAMRVPDRPPPAARMGARGVSGTTHVMRHE